MSGISGHLRHAPASPATAFYPANQSFLSRQPIFSADAEQVKQGIAQIEQILEDEDPPLAEVVAIEGAVPRLLQLLEHPDEETRDDASMCVMHLVCGDTVVTSLTLCLNTTAAANACSC
jgi:hypothetical protein